MQLRSHNIILGPFSLEQAETYREWVNDTTIGGMAGAVMPVTKTEHAAWYQQLVNDNHAVVFAITRTNADDYPVYIGNVWLWAIDYHHRKAEVRIIIGRDTDCGFGTQALGLISHFAFNHVNLHKLYAYVLSENTGAVKAFNNAGFNTECRLVRDRFHNGKYTDVLILTKFSRESIIDVK